MLHRSKLAVACSRFPALLRGAAWLGRTKGRFRVLDHLARPPRVAVKPDLSDWDQRELSAVWIGHATVLLRIGGMNVITDPVFSKRIGLGMGLFTLGSTRRVMPAITLKELPKIDLVLLSHAHFDHLDRPTLHRLPDDITVVTARHTAGLVSDLRFREVIELDWNEDIRIGGLHIQALEANHWGARTIYDRHRGYNGYMLETMPHNSNDLTDTSRRVLFFGDSAYHELYRGFDPVDLAIIGIGAYDPWIRNHANPEQAWEMTRHVRAARVLPVHHSTFRQSREPFDEPLSRLLAAAGRQSPSIIAHCVGDAWTFDPRAEKL